MTAEYLAPPIPQNREIVGSKAFNLEYLRQERSDQSIRDDIISYLGEYRFEIPKHEYNLLYSRDEAGKVSILASDGERMLDKSHRAIIEKKLCGDPTHREESETLGLFSLEKQLEDANEDDTLFWASPPGPKEEGYGNYGFIYRGKIRKERLEMAAFRLENPAKESFGRTMNFLSGDEQDFRDADDFLKAPVVVRGEVADDFLEKILRREFSFSENEPKQKEFESTIRFLNPLIDRVVYTIKNSSNKEKLAAFYALENYAIELRDKKEKIIEPNREYSVNRYDIDNIIATMDYEPLVVRGSCGSTGVSNMLFSGDSVINSILGSDMYGSREFNCPKCNGKNIRPVNQLLSECQHCGSSAVGCEISPEASETYQEAL